MPELPSSDALYNFLADEVFNSASADARTLLCRLAFVSAPTLDLARRLVDPEAADALLEEMERLGLVERERAELRLHPLMRDFLKARFAEYPADARENAIATLTEHLQAEHAWDDLFELVTHDPTPARVDALFGAAMRELVTEGRLGTLAGWSVFAEAQRIQTASAQLAIAELNLARGKSRAALPVTACRGFPSLVPAICTAARLEPRVTSALLRSRDTQSLVGKRRDKGVPSNDPPPSLSPREEEVFALLSRGLTNKQMAKTLFISDVTVKVHLRHIYRKLGVTSRLEAVALGLNDLADPR